ncbi:YncE family protein [Nocardioides limicola]|uniref:YncE family protein n=1 Tax=Nocardioides limicola TaxID=2803368 RepID=UPI0027DE1FD7|nr:serine/threonine protein kinase [Nocardioides sp. DJM-14]
MSRRLSLILVAALVAALVAVVTPTAASTQRGTVVGLGAGVAASLAAPLETVARPLKHTLTAVNMGDRPVMFVGNNWAGTATIVDARTFTPLKTINIIPDKAARMQEILLSPDKLVFYLAIQQIVGEGNDQYVDDMFTTRDGNLLAVSRPSFADVVWIDIATGRIVARQLMNGYRTDHMQVSPDGRRLLVSDSTDRTVHEYVMGGLDNPRTGEYLRSFESGETPHESEYIHDGAEILHASIGRVYTPGDYPELGIIHDLIKADRWFQRVRNSDFKILARWDMGKELAEAGFPNMSSAVRPMAVSPDERTVYLQVSFHHGYVVFDLEAPDLNGQVDYVAGGLPEPRTGAVRDVVHLPIADHVQGMLREQYVLDSAHHGLAINKNGRKLCVAGTMSDYGAIVHTADPSRRKLFHGGKKPYWATTSPFSNHCWMSMSGTDEVFVIDYATEKVVAKVPVGRHPQRVRDGKISRRVQLTL